MLKKGEHMKESRLFLMLYYILEKEKVTAKELAEKFEVSVRTIYRDIDWISSVGIPIFTTQGKSGGIEIDSDFVLSKSILTKDEKEQILSALNSLEHTSELYKNDLITKLSALFKIKNENWIEVDFTSWQFNKSNQNLFSKLKFAIINKKIVSFDYFSAHLEKTTREVKPVRLIFKNQDWYMYAFCNLRDDFRFFKLSRIKNLKTSQKNYDDDFSNITIGKKMQYENTLHVKLKFNKSQSFRVYDELDCDIEEDDEYLYANIDLPDNYILYSYVLSFGDDAEVLEPKEIRKKLEKMLKKMAKKYNT